MTFEEIKKAIKEGLTVHWSNDGYTVSCEEDGRCIVSHKAGDCVGLVTSEYFETARNNQFYIKE